MSADEFAAWLARSGNADEWARLREALALTDGFALFLLLVPDVATQAKAVALLESEAAAQLRGIIHADALTTGVDAPVRRFLATNSARSWLLLTTVEASRTDVEALERCFVQLNARRDQLVRRAQSPTLMLLRRDALRRLIDVAPDLYSVHASQFEFAQTEREPASVVEARLRDELGASFESGPFDGLSLLVAAELADDEGDLEQAALAYDQAVAMIIVARGRPAVLARGVEIFANSGEPERARQLADECWHLINYIDEVQPQTLATLAEFYAEHGPESRLEAIRARWQRAFPELPWPIPARQPPP